MLPHAQPQAPPQAAPLQPPQPPWTPFTPLPMDDEPAHAALRQRRLSKLMATSRFSAQNAGWRTMVTNEYTRMRQAVALASQPVAALPKGVTIQAKGDATTIGAEEQAAVSGMQGGTQHAPPQAQPQSAPQARPPSPRQAPHPPLRGPV
jgi:hypothetical protein